MTTRPTALIADDEPLLRDALAGMLRDAWPELEIVAHARNGREAIDRFEELRPDVCFLDVQMPGASGIDAARAIGRAAHLVFVTAYEQYALQAFAHGVLDYLVKPVEPARLAETVQRVRERLRTAAPVAATESLLAELAQRLARNQQGTLRWIRASVGSTVRLIPVGDVDYLRAEEKYTVVAWRDDGGRPREAVIRTPLKELVVQLDQQCFAQVHRAIVVNLAAVSQVVRHDNDTAELHLKGREEVLPVARSRVSIFRQM
jgi:DNA-binding LytR/AlgR family response regulator